MIAGDKPGVIFKLMDATIVPVLLIVSCGITTFVVLAAIWMAMFSIDAFFPALAWAGAILGRWFLAIGVAVFAADLVRRLWIVRSEILAQV